MKEPRKEVADGDTFLFHGVTVADGDGVLEGGVFFAEGFEVDGDTVGCSDFVLTTVTAADGGGVIVENVHEGLEEVFDFLGLFDELGLVLQKREDRDLDRCDAGLEAHDGADVCLAPFFGEVFFIVGLADEGEDGAVATGGGLDNVRDEALFGFLVEVFERAAGVLLVLAEVVVATVGDTFEFLLTEGEIVFDVVGFLRVVGPLAIRDVEDVELLFIESDLFVEGEAVGEPFVGEAEAIFGTAEVFHFHLLELTGAEGEVTRVDLVAEGFANLSDAEGEFDAVGVHDVLVLNEDGLCSFGSKVGGGVGIIFIGRGSHLGFEHEFKIAGLGEE